MQQSNLTLIFTLVSRRIGTPSPARVLDHFAEEADGGNAVRIHYSPEPISTLGALAQVCGRVIDFERDYRAAPLDFGDLGAPVNSPSAADNLGGIATDLGVERAQYVSTLTDQGVTLAARNYGAAPRRQKPPVVAAGRRVSLRRTAAISYVQRRADSRCVSPRASMMSCGSSPIRWAISINSTTSRRRSLFSILDMNDWGLPNLSASSACVMPRFRRAWISRSISTR